MRRNDADGRVSCSVAFASGKSMCRHLSRSICTPSFITQSGQTYIRRDLTRRVGHETPSRSPRGGSSWIDGNKCLSHTTLLLLFLLIAFSNIGGVAKAASVCPSYRATTPSRHERHVRRSYASPQQRRQGRQGSFRVDCPSSILDLCGEPATDLSVESGANCYERTIIRDKTTDMHDHVGIQGPASEVRGTNSAGLWSPNDGWYDFGRMHDTMDDPTRQRRV